MASVVGRKRKTGTFWSVIDYVEGHHVWRSAGSGKRGKAFAMRWASKLDELRLRRKAGFPVSDLPDRSTWTMADLKARDLERARDHGQDVPTREGRWAVLLREIGADTPIDNLTPGVIEGFIRARRAAGKRRSTVNKDMAVLSAALKQARRLGGFTGDPLAGIERLPETDSKPSRALTAKEVRRLLKAAWATGSWERAAIVEQILLTGSRTSEIFGLRREQVRGKLLVMPPNKKGTGRVFALRGRLGDLIREASSRTSRGESRLLGHRRGIRKWWASVAKTAGLPGLSLRELRTSAATELAERGATIPDIQRLLGHQSPAMAQRVYVKAHPAISLSVAYRSGLTAGKRHPALRGRRGRRERP